MHLYDSLVAADVFFWRFFDGSLALAFEEVEEAEAEEDDEEDDEEEEARLEARLEARMEVRLRRPDITLSACTCRRDAFS